ncbi:MAG: 5-(carboxyamino)imidazole ribonucleotide mutase [Kiritimatiellae bacterium]|nr:5-(carboxyamino)imidazole ribonucleotide mutase [Kiritimatiellia bacterium]
MVKKKAWVAIVMGSESDWTVMQHAVNTLKEFHIPLDVRILSAHRTPDEAAVFAREARQAGVRVIIAAAGMAAHLAGTMAAHSTLPVIGVPLKGGVLEGLDALLSTVQMPGGVPVATMALGKAGAVNAALFALRILALSDDELANKLNRHTENQREKALKADEALQRELAVEKSDA